MNHITHDRIVEIVGDILTAEPRFGEVARG